MCTTALIFFFLSLTVTIQFSCILKVIFVVPLFLLNTIDRSCWLERETDVRTSRRALDRRRLLLSSSGPIRSSAKIRIVEIMAALVIYRYASISGLVTISFLGRRHQLRGLILCRDRLPPVKVELIRSSRCLLCHIELCRSFLLTYQTQTFSSLRQHQSRGQKQFYIFHSSEQLVT